MFVPRVELIKKSHLHTYLSYICVTLYCSWLFNYICQIDFDFYSLFSAQNTLNFFFFIFMQHSCLLLLDFFLTSAFESLKKNSFFLFTLLWQKISSYTHWKILHSLRIHIIYMCIQYDFLSFIFFRTLILLCIYLYMQCLSLRISFFLFFLTEEALFLLIILLTQ